jgi:hypothetical protein
MSQKATRRARRQTADEDSTCKPPTPKPEESPPLAEEPETAPPQVPEEATNDVEKDNTTEDENGVDNKIEPETPQLSNGHEEQEKNELELSGKDTETEMDPLIVSDEPDPELVFEENSSEVESGKESPVLTRCKTRRSITRNIPTPKTPKSLEEDEETAQTESDNKDGDNHEELNVTFESCSENTSTKAVAGGDSTRLEYYIDKEASNLESNSFLQGNKNKTFGEALRHLSTRRTIRPISNQYRKRLLQTNLDKNLSATYPSRNSVERISSVGIKRKSCSEGEEEHGKRFKTDSPGFFSKFTSPLASIRNTFRSDLPSSTPKLTAYKDDKFLLEDDAVNSQLCEVNNGGERRWCSIM